MNSVGILLRGRSRASEAETPSRWRTLGSPEARAALRYAGLVTLAVRAGLGILGVISTGLIEGIASVGVPGWEAGPVGQGFRAFVTVFERFDALWYLRIADTGYQATDGSAAFFPLYPVLVRTLSWPLGGRPLAAGVLVALACTWGALAIVHRLTELELDRETARRTVLYLAVFPFGLFLFAPYSESLFLLLAASCLLAARRQRLGLAGLFAAAASATRSTGALLALPILVEGLRGAGLFAGARPWRVRRGAGPAWRWPPLLEGLGGALVAPAGLLAYLGYWQLRAGEALLPLRQQDIWQREPSWPWETVVRGLREGVNFVGAYPGGYAQLDALLVLVALAAAVWVALRAPVTYTAYVVPALVFPMLLIFGGRPFMSMPRFVLPLFPLFWALAAFARRFRAHDLVLAASAAGLGVSMLLFTNWLYIF